MATKPTRYDDTTRKKVYEKLTTLKREGLTHDEIAKKMSAFKTPAGKSIDASFVTTTLHRITAGSGSKKPGKRSGSRRAQAGGEYLNRYMKEVLTDRRLDAEQKVDLLQRFVS